MSGRGEIKASVKKHFGSKGLKANCYLKREINFTNYNMKKKAHDLVVLKEFPGMESDQTQS